jgi:hypothetical protein
MEKDKKRYTCGLDLILWGIMGHGRTGWCRLGSGWGRLLVDSVAWLACFRF